VVLKRKSEDGFNLSFLDVMACGLGAVILIFMLLKFDAPSVVNEDVEAQRLQQELQQLLAEKTRVQTTLENVTGQTNAQQLTLTQLKSAIAALKQQQRASAQAVKSQTDTLSQLEQAVETTIPEVEEDVLALEGAGEEAYLLGLKMQGKVIGLLIDSSASMTDEKLVDIIRSKISSDAEKRQAHKWQRTKRVARWLLARTPKEAKLAVVAFNQTAERLTTTGAIAASDSEAMNQVAIKIDTITPQGGTNLQAALKAMVAANPGMTHLYLVTDGLPTLGEQGSGLTAFRKCGSFFGRSSTITGECRLHLFSHTLKHSLLRDVEVNVILMPLEGDPAAADAYWQWSAATGGLMISPARSWP
jgi:hypothetical protein